MAAAAVGSSSSFSFSGSAAEATTTTAAAATITAATMTATAAAKKYPEELLTDKSGRAGLPRRIGSIPMLKKTLRRLCAAERTFALRAPPF